MSAPDRPLRVVELAQGVAGPVCGRLFAALGHSVVKYEPPGGDYLRSQQPLGVHGDGLAFITLNADKQSVVLPADDSARAILGTHLADADVLVVDLGPGQAAAWGLDPQHLRDRFPNLVTVSVTGFGQTGEYAGTPADSMLAEAYGGLATMVGDPDRRPLSLGGEQCAYAAGLTGFLGAALALMRRDRGHGGDFVDVAMCDVAAYLDWKSDVAYAMTGTPPRRGHSRDDAWRVVPAADGWVGVIFQDRHWAALVDLVGDDALRDPALKDEQTRLARIDHWWPRLEQWIARQPAQQVYDAAQRHGLPFGWVVDVAALARSTQLHGRGFILDTVPGDERRPAVGPPFQASELTWRSGTAPALGGPAAATSRAAGPAAHDRDRDRGAGPLSGITVLDFGTITAGAATTRLLADFGATVIKIEWVTQPDTFRSWKTPGWGSEADRTPQSPYFPSNNVGKWDVGINLKNPQGRELVHRLAEHAHLLVENFRVGVTERLGIDYESIHRTNPRLVYLSLSSQGQHGPEAANSSFGSTLDLLSGLASLTGYSADEPMWSSSDVNYPDQLVALFGAALATYCLRAGARGVHLDVSQREVVSWTLGAEIAATLTDGTAERASGNRRPGATPHDIYATAGTDRWVAIACRTDADRCALASCLGRPEMGQHDAAWWRDHQDVIDGEITAWTAARDRDIAVAQLRQHGVPAVPVLTAADRAARPRFRQRLVTLPAGEGGPGKGSPVKGYPMLFSQYLPPHPTHAPQIGEHTRDVLATLAGLRPDEVDALEAAGVIVCGR